MIPYYVCDVKYPILSAPRLLDRGYNLKLDTQHSLLSHGDNTAPLLRQRGLFYLAIKRSCKRSGWQTQLVRVATKASARKAWLARPRRPGGPVRQAPARGRLCGHARGPKPRLEFQGSDGYLKKRLIAKGELGYFSAKHIISALPEDGERPSST